MGVPRSFEDLCRALVLPAFKAIGAHQRCFGLVRVLLSPAMAHIVCEAFHRAVRCVYDSRGMVGLGSVLIYLRRLTLLTRRGFKIYGAIMSGSDKTGHGNATHGIFTLLIVNFLVLKKNHLGFFKVFIPGKAEWGGPVW